MDNLRMVKAYIRIRDARNDARRKFEEEDAKFKEKQELIENAMLKELNDTGTDSMKTVAGTFYKQEEIIPSGSDWDAFYKWIAKKNAFEALERRIKKTFIKEFMEANAGAIPPGVTVHREYVVRVRRGDK